MSPFMIEEAVSRIEVDAPPIYDLYATVNHSGQIYRGHYIAQARGISKDSKRGAEYSEKMCNSTTW